MVRVLKVVGRLLFALLVTILFAPYVIPPFLDRIYYRGPPSDHFDGQRFFNPDGSVAAAAQGRARWSRFMLGLDRVTWPGSVPVRPTQPPTRVADYADASRQPCEPPSNVYPPGWIDACQRVIPMRVTWIGHATALVQTDNLNILTDPVWSERASPVPFAGPKRVRAPGVRLDDLPKIDLVLISHNHYDHLDVATLKRLWDRDRPVIVTSLGNDTILRRKGIGATARDWGGSVRLYDQGIDVIVDRVHHWSSRFGKDRNRALWSGFTVVLPGGNLFFAGDTGMGDGRWPAEAAAHGPIRLALIPIGALSPRDLMADSHLDPDEAVTVFERLGAANALGIHWGTFQLTDEGIDEPRRELARALARRGIAAGRFRTTEVGVAWDVPPLQPANSPSAATSSSVSEMPKRAASVSR